MNGDTLIILIIFSSLAFLLFIALLSRLYRYFSSNSNPLPPVQSLRLSYHRNKDNDDDDYVLVDPFRLATPPLPRPRPISVASSSRLSTVSLSSGRRGLPHSPHSQMHIVLPVPLSVTPSSAVDELGHLIPTPRLPRSSRHFLDVSSEYDRRSMSFVDRWLPTPSIDSYSLSSSHPTTDTAQQRIPSPLIPHSPSSSSLVKAHAHNPKLFPSRADIAHSESLPLIPIPDRDSTITTDHHIPDTISPV